MNSHLSFYSMEQFFKISTLLLAFATFFACSEDTPFDNSLNLVNDHKLKSVSIKGADFQVEEGTRSTVIIDNIGVHFLWSANDTVGIFPNKGSQVEFAVDEGVGMQTATFDGGGWALKHSSAYSAYYPYNFYNRNLASIPVTYVGQIQNGNASTTHLGAYDYMAATVVTPANGSLEFEMQHLGCLVMLQTSLEEEKTLKSVTLKAGNEAFTMAGAIDLTTLNPAIMSTSSSQTYTIALQNFEVGAEETTTIYWMMAPTNLLGGTLEITLSDESGAYMKFNVAGKNFVAGKAYAYFLTEGEKLGATLPEYAVNLGLPSGTLWADRNVGAATPEAYGDYFAWGETEPKEYYDWSTYKWCNGSSSTMTKYCTDSDFGIVDDKMILEPTDDAATINMGAEWRMPTHEEASELRNHCTWTWEGRNGVNGYKVTGPNGNSIFLPAAGYRNDGDLGYSQLSHAGSGAIYRSSSLIENVSSYAYAFYFTFDGKGWVESGRHYGQPVRAVVR